LLNIETNSLHHSRRKDFLGSSIKRTASPPANSQHSRDARKRPTVAHTHKHTRMRFRKRDETAKDMSVDFLCVCVCLNGIQKTL